MKKIFTICTLVAIYFFVSSCHSEGIEEVKPENSEALLNYIKSLGIAEDNIIDQGDHYLVEGDMRFSKKMEIPTSLAPNEEQAFRAHGTLVWKGGVQNDIKVKIGTGVQSFATNIRAAMNMWSRAGSKILFREVTGVSYDILITEGTVIAGAAASSDLPVFGEPGPTIYMTKRIFDNLSKAKREGILAHELGHAIGFLHTNGPESGSAKIPRTTWYDLASVMRPGGDGQSIINTVLSAGDKLAVATMYPIIPYSVRLNQSRLQWYGPLHRVQSSKIWYKITTGTANGPVLAQTPADGVIHNGQIREGNYYIPVPDCNCGRVVVLQAKVKTRYSDNFESPWSPVVQTIIN